MTPEEVGKALLKTPSGRFELRLAFLDKNADYLGRELAIPRVPA